MKKKKWMALVMTVCISLSGCSSPSGGGGAQTSDSKSVGNREDEIAASIESHSEGGNVFMDENISIGEGTITVLTNVIEGDRLAKLNEWAKEFDDLYPGKQTVEFETIDDYENQVKIRLSSTDYGDVLLIPKYSRGSKSGRIFSSFGKLPRYGGKISVY